METYSIFHHIHIQLTSLNRSGLFVVFSAFAHHLNSSHYIERTDNPFGQENKVLYSEQKRISPD